MFGSLSLKACQAQMTSALAKMGLSIQPEQMINRRRLSYERHFTFAILFALNRKIMSIRMAFNWYTKQFREFNMPYFLLRDNKYFNHNSYLISKLTRVSYMLITRTPGWQTSECRRIYLIYSLIGFITV